MRVIADLASFLSGTPKLVQAGPEPDLGVRIPVNGQYVIPIPPGVTIPVGPTSYTPAPGSDSDGGDVASQGYAGLLAAYPQFGHVYFNPLLTVGNVGELSSTAVFKDPGTANLFTPRFQTGRSAAGPTGQMPGHTALLAANAAVTPTRPGLIVSNLIDIGALTADCDGNLVGTDQFMLYWKLHGFATTEDIASDSGAFPVGTNSPAFRHLIEVDQEFSGFTAYLSPDDGATWCATGLLEPLSFAAKTKKIRVAFVNTTASKVYLSSFGVMF